MRWIFLFAAGALEIVWSVALKMSNGFTEFWASVAAIVGSLLSFALLSLALRELPLGAAYAIWTGIGIVGSVLAGAAWFGESLSAAQTICVAMIVGGIAGLRLLS